jgi:peptide subunit release factor RF-3
MARRLARVAQFDEDVADSDRQRRKHQRSAPAGAAPHLRVIFGLAPAVAALHRNSVAAVNAESGKTYKRGMAMRRARGCHQLRVPAWRRFAAWQAGGGEGRRRQWQDVAAAKGRRTLFGGEWRDA